MPLPLLALKLILSYITDFQLSSLQMKILLCDSIFSKAHSQKNFRLVLLASVNCELTPSLKRTISPIS